MDKDAKGKCSEWAGEVVRGHPRRPEGPQSGHEEESEKKFIEQWLGAVS